MSYAAPQGKFAKRLKKDKDKWRAEMSAEGEDWRAIVEELEAEIADLKRQLEAANQTCSDAREQEYGCFRAVRAERLLAEAQGHLRHVSKFMLESFDDDTREELIDPTCEKCVAAWRYIQGE